MPRLAGPLLVIQVSQPQPDMFFMKNNSSEKLLARYLEGDPAESFDASLKIHARYQNRLILLARSRLLGVFRSKVDADDITQEVFVAFFEMAKRNEIRWKDRGDLWRLLAGIAINKVKQQHERFSTIKRNAHNESRLTTESSAVDEREIDQLAELVEHVLESEKPLVATILNLRLAGFSFEEIAHQIGRSTRTVRRLLESLKAKLVQDHELGLFRLYNEVETKAQIASVDYRDFQLLRMIGQGSFSKVYLARHVSGQFFAIKAIKKKWLKNEEARKSFCREAELLMSLSDPSFVKTYGVGRLPNGGCFLVLELIEGETLASLIETASLADRKFWCSEIRKAVDRLHAANLVHGDIDASNVMVDHEGKVKLLDFGLGCRISGRKKISAVFDRERMEVLCRTIVGDS